MGHDNKFLKTHLARRRVLKSKEEAKSEGAKKRGSLNDRKSEKERTSQREKEKRRKEPGETGDRDKGGRGGEDG